jgi:hypothetical protein
VREFKFVSILNVLQNQALLSASEAENKMLLSQAEQLVKSQQQSASPVAAALEKFVQKLQVWGSIVLLVRV